MTLGAIVLLMLGSVFFELILQAALLRLSCKMWAKQVSFRRALLTCATIAAVTVPVLAVLAFRQLNAPVDAHSNGQGWSLAIELLAVALSVAIIQRFLKIGVWRSFVSWLVATIPATLLGLGMAFAFRAYFAEAFIVPTGSMAFTLLGTNSEVHCTNCGQAFPVSMSDRNPGGDLPGRPPLPKTAICPNCGERQEIAPTVPAHPGDRIVAKKTNDARRWDLVLYHPPEAAEQVYVHRLIGLPGEHLDLVGGDLFVNQKRLAKPPREFADLWIAVHDTEFAPKNISKDTPRWMPDDAASAWKPVAQGWNCAATGADTQTLKFTGVLRDVLAYNAESNQGGGRGAFHPVEVPIRFCGDTRIRCHVEGCAGDGKFSFAWSFRGQNVTASVASNGKLDLAATGDEPGQAATGQAVGKSSGGQVWTFAVRDGTAYLYNEQEAGISLQIFSEDLNAAMKEEPANEPCTISLSANGIDVTITRIEIARDVYFRNANEMNHGDRGWGTPQQPIQLQADEYFLLGDNSSSAADCRFRGPVKRDALVGVARSIYWPPSRWRNFP